MQRFRTKLSEKDQAVLRNLLAPVWTWRPHLHALVTGEVQSVPAKERHDACSQALQCRDLAVTFLSLPACNGVGEKTSCWGFVPCLV